MAVRQAEIAAANLAAEINGQEPVEHYLHEVKMVIDDGEGKAKYESQKFSDLSHSNLLVQHGVLNYCARAE
jgi:hypothetical protein